MSVHKYASVRVRVVFVTPSMAAEWLKRNTANRRIVPSVVRFYMNELANGRFSLSNDAICFDANEILKNGQHRLTACVNTGIGFWAIVAEGLPADAMFVMDQGLKRRVPDVIRLAGEGDLSTNCVALLNALRFPTWTGAGRRMGAEETAAYYQQHRVAVDFVIGAAGNGTKGVCCAPVLAAIARAYYHVDPVRLRAFIRALCKGEEVEPGNEAAFKLARFLSSNTGIPKKEKHQKTEWAIAAFMNRENPSRVLSAREELFPLPEEQEDEISEPAPQVA